MKEFVKYVAMGFLVSVIMSKIARFTSKGA